MSPNDQLEHDLRTALRAEADALRVAPDPWQRNQRRLAADASRHSRYLLAAAAAVLAVATTLGAAALLRGDGSGGAASGGADDAFHSSNILGEVVEAETGLVDGERAVHEIVLTDTTGDGPDLCDRYLAASSGGGGCTPRSAGADKPGVAFDWLARSDAIGELRGVVAGVDDRVTTVRIWMADGEMMDAKLHPTGWEGTQMFAVSVDASDPVPQRMVAYGRDNVLQAVDLPSRMGDGWVKERSACDGDPVVTFGAPAPAVAGDVRMAVGTLDAMLTIQVTATEASEECVQPLRATAIAGWHAAVDRAGVIVAPEVERVRIIGAGIRHDLQPGSAVGTPWRVASTHLSGKDLQAGEVIAFDGAGNELDREFLHQPASP